MKVLIVHPNTPIFGGAENVIYEFAKYLVRHGHHGLYLSTGENNKVAARLEGIIPCSIAVNYSPYIGKLGEVMALKKVVQEHAHDFDVVFAHNFPATLACEVIKTPVIWQCNEPPELFTSLLRKPVEAYHRWFIRNRIKNVIVADNANAARFERLYRVKPAIIPYGVDYDFWSQTPAREPDGHFNVIQIGTITPYKNQLASLQAVAELVKDIPNIRLMLVGEASGKYYKKVLKEANKLNGRVVFTGHASREQVRSFLGQADVVSHPVKSQGGWLVPFEAIAAGKPVSVSRNFTAADIIRDNHLGYIADSIKLNLIIIKSWLERGNLKSVTETRQAYVRDNLSWEQYGDKVMEVFEHGKARTGVAQQGWAGQGLKI